MGTFSQKIKEDQLLFNGFEITYLDLIKIPSTDPQRLERLTQLKQYIKSQTSAVRINLAIATYNKINDLLNEAIYNGQKKEGIPIRSH